MPYLKAIYLGDTDDGAKMRSEYLDNCAAQETFNLFKKDKLDTQTAPILVDLMSDDDCITETIGVSEKTFTKVTGEVVMDLSYYEREQVFVEDVIFGSMINQLEDAGHKIPDSELKKQCQSALRLKKFRESDYALVELNVDDLITETP